LFWPKADGEEDAGSGVAVEDVIGDQPGDQGAADAGEHRLEDAHRVGADQEQPGERADDEAAEGKQNDVADYLDGAALPRQVGRGTSWP
jgi:hypothetical protein